MTIFFQLRLKPQQKLSKEVFIICGVEVRAISRHRIFEWTCKPYFRQESATAHQDMGSDIF